jgi:hypothetical protein
MSPSTKRFGYAIVFVVALSALYAVSYFVLVMPEVVFSRGSQPAAVRVDTVPSYRIGGTTLRPFFEPVHQLDRRVRPTLWESGETDWR